MVKQIINPFVKWAGGKKQLLDKLKPLIPQEFNRYYEPFIGGGALLFSVQPKNAIINDINSQLINVYHQLKINTDSVINYINCWDTTECDKEFYLKQREKYNLKIRDQKLDEECAALTIWINKHCFNGLYRVNSKGYFNVPYNNKTNGPSINEDNIRNIGRYLNENQITIKIGDFETACCDATKDDFIYFDSPYIPVSNTANFTDYTKDGFSHDDHIRLANLFKNLSTKGVKLMLSNHNVPLVYELYKDYNIRQCDVRRAINSDASKRTGKEVIITNY